MKRKKLFGQPNKASERKVNALVARNSREFLFRGLNSSLAAIPIKLD